MSHLGYPTNQSRSTNQEEIIRRSWPWARLSRQFYTLQRLYRCTHKSWFHHPSATKKPPLCSLRTFCWSQEITKRPLQSILLPSTRPLRFHRGGRSHPKAPHRSPLLSQSNNQSRVLSRHPLITRSDFPIKPCGRHCITRLRLLQEQVLRTQRHVHHITKVSCTHAPTIILMPRIPHSKPHHQHHHNKVDHWINDSN